jgi:alpha-ketoglutarate-dependent taurine dioxygenase
MTERKNGGGGNDFSRFDPARLGRRDRQVFRVSTETLVRMRPLRSEGPLPLLVEPAVAGVDIAAWAASNRERLEKDLLAHGAILLRGFAVDSVEKFQRLITGLWGPLLQYTFGSTPRSHVSGNVYTSTEYPAHQEIPLHNEMSYSRDWPLKIWFLCLQPSLQGGETPLGDSRKVYERIDPRISNRFAEKKVLYVRNYGEGLDVPWQKVFETSDRARVEQLCGAAGIEWEWRDGNRLRTRELCQAVARHPRTGETVWFNQAHLFHVSSLPPEGREALLSTFAEEDLPRNAYYGDGSPIEEGALESIRAVLRAETVAFRWGAGDVLLVDNMLTAHGRRPFSGPRRVVVGMTDSYGKSGEAASAT